MYSLSDPQADAPLSSPPRKRGVKVRVLLDSDPAGGGGRAANQRRRTRICKAHGVQVQMGLARRAVAPEEHRPRRQGRSHHDLQPVRAVLPGRPGLRGHRARAATVVRHRQPPSTPTSRTPSRPPVPGAAREREAPEAGVVAGRPEAAGGADSVGHVGSTLYAETEQLDSPAIEQALIAAAARGVTVDVTMTQAASWASGMDALAAGGVHLRVVQNPAPPCTSTPRPWPSTAAPSTWAAPTSPQP